jgi:hypothetical protein
MGTDYYGSIDVGFRFSPETLTMPFGVHREEKFHMEDRFDPTTGKKLKEQEKVIDEDEEVVFILDGEEHAYEYEFYAALCKKLGCTFVDMDYDEDNHSVFLGVKLPDQVGPGVGFGRFELGGLLHV